MQTTLKKSFKVVFYLHCGLSFLFNNISNCILLPALMEVPAAQQRAQTRHFHVTRARPQPRRDFPGGRQESPRPPPPPPPDCGTGRVSEVLVFRVQGRQRQIVDRSSLQSPSTSSQLTKISQCEPQVQKQGGAVGSQVTDQKTQTQKKFLKKVRENQIKQ